MLAIFLTSNHYPNFDSKNFRIIILFFLYYMFNRTYVDYKACVSFGNFFLWFVASKEIGLHMVLLANLAFWYNLWNRKKDIIGVVHRNQKKWENLISVWNFFPVINPAYFALFSFVPLIYKLKIRLDKL